MWYLLDIPLDFQIVCEKERKPEDSRRPSHRINEASGGFEGSFFAHDPRKELERRVSLFLYVGWLVTIYP